MSIEMGEKFIQQSCFAHLTERVRDYNPGRLLAYTGPTLCHCHILIGSHCSGALVRQLCLQEKAYLKAYID